MLSNSSDTVGMAYSRVPSEDLPSSSVNYDVVTPYKPTCQSSTTKANLNGERSHKPSMDDVLNFIGYGSVQLLAFILASITAMGFGFEMVIFASINIPLEKQMNVSELEYAILPASTNVANLPGSFIYSILSDRYGRVWPYALILLQIGVFGLASAFSTSFTMLVILRALVSVSAEGAVVLMSPTLLEFLPVRNRGKVMVLVLLVESIGACVTGGLAWWLIPAYPVNGWRYLLIASAIPFFIGTLYRILFFFESPRVLFARGKFKESKKVLKRMAWLNGKNLSDFIPDSSNLEDFLFFEKHSKRSCSQSIRTLLSIFNKPYLRTTILLGFIYVTETVSYFSAGVFIPQVLQNFGVNPFFTAFVGYLGQIPGIAFMAIIIEWPGVGRLNALRFFSLLTAISFFVFAFVRDQVSTSVLIVFINFSIFPMLPLLFTYISEVYPTEIRSFANGFFNALSPLVGIGVLFAGSYMTDLSVTLPWLFPTVWGIVFVVQFVLSLFLNHETRGKELDDTVKGL